MNPFDDPDGEFLVLVNEEGQFSLWPSFCDVPPGWSVDRERGARQDCVDHIERNWVDMRPNSLVAGADR